MTRKPKISASAELSGKAQLSISHQKKITEHIPEDVSRAKAAAWLDIISPFTEWAGLKGDALRHKRDLLRLQQEETLAVLARSIRNKIKHISNPLPNKFLIPFLEKASLEQPDDPIVELWSNLFLSAAEEYNPHYIHFQSIISQMSKIQAEIFSRSVNTDNAHTLELSMDFIRTEIKDAEDHIYNYMNYKIGKGEIDTKTICDAVYAAFDRPGIFFVYAAVITPDQIQWDIDPGPNGYNDKNEIDCEILCALGLLRKIETEIVTFRSYEINAILYTVTPLGAEFAKACKLAR